jgi:acyl-CoA reductase-like NAD-dependent aldehyde dehydrogenase
MVATAKPTSYKMYIAGRWVDADDGGTFDVLNPATEEVISPVPDAGTGEMRQAIAAARAAFDEGPWPRLAPRERARIMEQIAEKLEARRERLRELLTAEVGCAQYLMPIQLEDPLRFMRGYAELAAKLETTEMLEPLIQESPLGGLTAQQMMVYRQPAGVVGAINTWNFPLYVLVQKLGPALAAGCTVVVKTSPWAPLLNLEVAKAIEETDLPKGVFNVVTGSGVAISEELVSSAQIDKISFTGSVPTGKRIAEAAAKHLARVHLELGGKSACIVLDDADVESIGPSLASPAFVHAGQGCALATRALVPASMYEKAVEKMVDFVSHVKVGDPADPAVLLGPLIREERRTAVEAYVRVGQEEGATLAAGGGRPKGLERGFFLEPTVFCDVRNDMRIAREEIFGPVQVVLPYRDLDEAVRIANDSPFGLSGQIVTKNAARGIEVAKRLRTGSVLIVSGTGWPGGTPFGVAPFGGFKESGIGREGGKYGVLEFTEVQSIIW